MGKSKLFRLQKIYDEVKTVQESSVQTQTPRIATSEMQTDNITVQSMQIQTENVQSQETETQTLSDDEVPALQKYQIIAEAETELRRTCIKDLIEVSNELERNKEALKKLETLNEELKEEVVYFKDRLAFKE